MSGANDHASEEWRTIDELGRAKTALEQLIENHYTRQSGRAGKTTKLDADTRRNEQQAGRKYAPKLDEVCFNEKACQKRLKERSPERTFQMQVCS